MLQFLKYTSTALVEGITEFIPISSTGHMIIFGNLINFTGEKVNSFEIFVQLGAILAVVIIYPQKFITLLPKQFLPHQLHSFISSEKKSLSFFHFFYATLPALIAGFFLYPFIKKYLFTPYTVAIGLIIGGVAMIIIEKIPIKRTIQKLEDISFKQAFMIGVGQCCALWPGFSRSASSILTGLLLKIDYKPAADFSFIIAVPLMFAAVSYDLLKSWSIIDLQDLPYFLTGSIVAFIVAWLSIKWFLKILQRIKLMPFAIYRIILGVVIILSI